MIDETDIDQVIQIMHAYEYQIHLTDSTGKRDEVNDQTKLEAIDQTK